jgi:hypothetical protein
LIFGSLAIISLFIFFNLGKMKASSKQLNRNNRINRFGGQQNTHNIIEGESKEITDEDKN